MRLVFLKHLYIYRCSRSKVHFLASAKWHITPCNANISTNTF
jgi:hypothetical protein